MAGTGGKRAGAGRKRKMEEDKIKEIFDPLLPFFINAMKEGLKMNDASWGRIFTDYHIGRPLQRTEVTGANGAPIQFEEIKTYIASSE